MCQSETVLRIPTTHGRLVFISVGSRFLVSTNFHPFFDGPKERLEFFIIPYRALVRLVTNVFN